MYVCICNAITDKQIRAAAEAGATDLWGLQAELGVATNCGSCKDVAAEILAEYRQPNVGADRVRDYSSEPQIYIPATA